MKDLVGFRKLRMKGLEGDIDVCRLEMCFDEDSDFWIKQQGVGRTGSSGFMDWDTLSSTPR